MSATRQNLQPSAALSIGTRFSLLLLASLVADSRPEVDLVSVVQDASGRADQDAEARLLEDVHIVVVGVPHRPAAGMSSGFLAVRSVNEAAVSVGPLLKSIVIGYLL